MTDETVRAMFTSLSEYFDSVRKFGETSGSVTQSFAGFYGSHPPSQESIVGKLNHHIYELLPIIHMFIIYKNIYIV